MTKNAHVAALPIVAAVAAALAACAPMATAIPFQTMQRAESLPEHAQSIAIAAGAGVGGVGWPVGAMGGALQARFGIGHDRELSVSGQAIAHKCDGCAEGQRDTHIGIAGRLGVKWSFDRVALLVGTGLSGYPGGRAVGLDGAVIRDVGHGGYVSLRTGVADPIEQDSAAFADGKTVPVTGYVMGAAGWHGGAHDAFVIEGGMGLVQAGEHDSGAAFYGLVGVDLLKL